PERIIPSETPGGIIEHHLAKYRFAVRLGLEGPVLDAACGVGYATAWLAEAAATPAVGVEIAASALDTASSTYRDRATFVRADVTRMPFAENSFGSVVGFETV